MIPAPGTPRRVAAPLVLLAILTQASCEASPEARSATPSSSPATAEGPGSAGSGSPEASPGDAPPRTGEPSDVAERSDAGKPTRPGEPFRVGPHAGGAPPESAQEPKPGPGEAEAPRAKASAGDRRLAHDDWDPPRFERPDSLRGIYLTAWTSGSAARSEALLDLARETELNTFVVDIKDASGYVSHRTDVEMAREVGADGEIRIHDLRRLLDRMAEEGIYPVARIVVFKDHLLPAARPDLAVRPGDDGGDGELTTDGELTADGERAADGPDADGGALLEPPVAEEDDEAGEAFWRDAGGHPWSSPRAREVWDYHVELAREVAELGFPEIQWDYVRFPDIPDSVRESLTFPGGEQGARTRVIRSFLDHSRRELEDLDVRVTADVFGISTSARADVGIGQVWEEFIDVVDAALPMVYPSHYWAGSFGLEEPNARPYEVIWRALGDARGRSEGVEGAGEVIPWLQDFSMGSPAYGAPEVRAQIQATYDRGIPHWILWNPGSRYTRAALEPPDGFPEGHDPLIRLGGFLVPASQRLESYIGPGGAVPWEGFDALRSTKEAETGFAPPQLFRAHLSDGRATPVDP